MFEPTTSKGPSMFQELYAVARHTPLHLIITPNGPQLRVIVTPKPSGEAANHAALAKPFSVTGMPEELDAEFGEALRQYAQGVNDLRMKLDLPLSELEEAARKAEKRGTAKSAPAPKRDEKKPAARKRTQAAAAPKAGKPAASATAEPTTAETTSAPIANPVAAWPFPTGNAAEEPKHRAGLPGKEECIRDYEQMKLKHGDKLTRRLFIKQSQTGRRYEKLWPNWAKFVKEAEAQQQLPLEEPKAASEPAAATNENPPRKGEGSDTHTHVYDEAGNYLSSITSHPEIGKHIALVGQEHLLCVIGVETRPSGGLDVTVVPDPEETARRANAIADKVRAQAAEQAPDEAPSAEPASAAEAPSYALVERGTHEVLGTTALELQPGEVYVHAPGEHFHVDDRLVEPAGYLVHRMRDREWLVIEEASGETLGRTAEIYKPGDTVGRIELEKDGLFRVTEVLEHTPAYLVRPVLPHKIPIIDQTTHASLGETDEIYEVTDQVLELAEREYRVVEVTGTAYFVKAAKPRVRGPQAVPVIATTAG